jgi:DNA repair exonuclease SbcCD ATPase subunit
MKILSLESENALLRREVELWSHYVQQYLGPVVRFRAQLGNLFLMKMSEEIQKQALTNAESSRRSEEFASNLEVIKRKVSRLEETLSARTAELNAARETISRMTDSADALSVKHHLEEEIAARDSLIESMRRANESLAAQLTGYQRSLPSNSFKNAPDLVSLIASTSTSRIGIEPLSAMRGNDEDPLEHQTSEDIKLMNFLHKELASMSERSPPRDIFSCANRSERAPLVRGGNPQSPRSPTIRPRAPRMVGKTLPTGPFR